MSAEYETAHFHAREFIKEDNFKKLIFFIQK